MIANNCSIFYAYSKLLDIKCPIISCCLYREVIGTRKQTTPVYYIRELHNECATESSGVATGPSHTLAIDQLNVVLTTEPQRGGGGSRFQPQLGKGTRRDASITVTIRCYVIKVGLVFTNSPKNWIYREKTVISEAFCLNNEN